jgi:hypothetical protein
VKKLKGLKRKWKNMLINLDEMAEQITLRDDEIFIVESFHYFNVKIDTKHKRELLEKLLSILWDKQSKSGRYYLLWYCSDAIFESTILIFNCFEEVEKFIEDRNPKKGTDLDAYFLHSRNFDKLEQYIRDSVKNENILPVMAKNTTEEYLDSAPIVLIADRKIIEMAKKKLEVS